MNPQRLSAMARTKSERKPEPEPQSPRRLPRVVHALQRAETRLQSMRQTSEQRLNGPLKYAGVSDPSNPESQGAKPPPNRCAATCSVLSLALLHPHTLKTILVTVSNSGDNIIVYLPLFAAASTGQIFEIIILFYALLVALMLLARVLLSCRVIQSALEQYGEYITPWLLIGIGIYILSGSIVFHPHPV